MPGRKPRRLETATTTPGTRSYVAKGVSIQSSPGVWSGHPECLRYRVIAVDEAGNESAPAVAWTNETATCPGTPDPPKNLRASNNPLSSACETRLEWDPSTTGATEYYVYRAIIVPTAANFYDTQRVVAVPPSGLPTSYVEKGDPLGYEVCPDECCKIVSGSDAMCGVRNLAAYYVTARGASGGESPRSNLVFWKWGTPPGGGYAAALSKEATSGAIAAFGMTPPNESLACWIAGEASPDFIGNVGEDWAAPGGPTELAIEPMRRLGQVNEPLWVVYDLHTDHLGSVRAITNSNGAPVSFHNYFPFGEEITEQGSYNTHRYTGHERDQATGLDYMLARYYSASLSRFLSTDPVAIKPERLRIPQRLNLYTYAANNPIKFFDPTGEDVEVGNRAVKGTLGIGAHAFIVVKPTGANVEKFRDRTDPNTGTITLSGHPKDGKLVRTQNDARDVGKAEQTINVAAPKGTSMEKFEANVIQASDSYKNDAKYEATPGPGAYNSNGLASGTLKAAGSDQTPTVLFPSKVDSVIA